MITKPSSGHVRLYVRLPLPYVLLLSVWRSGRQQRSRRCGCVRRGMCSQMHAIMVRTVCLQLVLASPGQSFLIFHGLLQRGGGAMSVGPRPRPAPVRRERNRLDDRNLGTAPPDGRRPSVIARQHALVIERTCVIGGTKCDEGQCRTYAALGPGRLDFGRAFSTGHISVADRCHSRPGLAGVDSKGDRGPPCPVGSCSRNCSGGFILRPSCRSARTDGAWAIVTSVRGAHLRQ